MHMIRMDQKLLASPERMRTSKIPRTAKNGDHLQMGGAGAGLIEMETYGFPQVPEVLYQAQLVTRTEALTGTFKKKTGLTIKTLNQGKKNNSGKIK